MTVTWDTVNHGTNVTFSGGNLTAAATGATADRIVRSTASISGSQKVYFRVTDVAETAGGFGVGLCNATENLNSFLAADNNGMSYWDFGSVNINNASVHSADGYVGGDVIWVAVNKGTNKAWVRRNTGGWFNDVVANQNPSNGTGGVDISALGATIFAAANIKTAGDTATADFATVSADSTLSGFVPLDTTAIAGQSMAAAQGSVKGGPGPQLVSLQASVGQGAITLSGVVTTVPLPGIALGSAIGAILAGIPTPNRSIVIPGLGLTVLQGQAWIDASLSVPQSWVVADRSG